MPRREWEQLLAEAAGGGGDEFRILSVPFYLDNVSLGDIVNVRRVQTRAADYFEFRDVARHAGHNTYRLLLASIDGRGPQRGYTARPAYARAGPGPQRPQPGAAPRWGRASSLPGGGPPFGISRPFHVCFARGQKARPPRKEALEAAVRELRAKGLGVEAAARGLLAVDVPPEAEQFAIDQFLLAHALAGRWELQDGHCCPLEPGEARPRGRWRRARHPELPA